MIVLSLGMPRAGSGWHYNLIHDLVVASGGQDARLIRRRYLLSLILTEVNCNIGALTAKRLLPVLLPSLLGNTFAIKAHAGPTPLALRLIRVGRIRATYIYRDPRAALLSAFEYGQRGASGFSHLATFEDALRFMDEYVRIWDAWTVVPQVLSARYEDLFSDYAAEIARLLSFLDVDAQDPSIQAVVEKYGPGQAAQGDKGLHFFKGQPERFRTALAPEQLAACNRLFAPYLERMGYTL